VHFKKKKKIEKINFLANFPKFRFRNFILFIFSIQTNTIRKEKNEKKEKGRRRKGISTNSVIGDG
jgi:hypothetical protein